MNDICLVYTPIFELIEDRLEAPLGLLYLASYLKSKGHSVELCDLSGTGSNPDNWQVPPARYYGFSTFSTTYHRTLQIKEKALQVNPLAKTIAGGAHASAIPSECKEEFDYVVTNEGEAAILSIIRNESEDKLIYGEPIWNLDDIPFPDYSMVDVWSYKREVAGKHGFSILSSRGCPFKCEFCNSKIMGGGTRLRFRSPENVFREINEIRENYGDVAFRFQDDIFGLSTKWLQKFTELIKPLNIYYRAFVRADQCKRNGFTDLLYKGGCRHIAIGVESGSDYILERMMKGETVEDMLKGIYNAKQSGLLVRIYLIVGYPGETWETVKQTIDLVKMARPDEFVVYPLIPYPGTPLYNFPEQYGIKNIDQDFTKYFQIYADKQAHFVYDLDYVDRKELTSMRDYVIEELEKLKLTWAKDSKGFV